MPYDNLFNENKKETFWGVSIKELMYFINFNSNHILNYFLLLLEPKHSPVPTHLPMCLPDFPLLRRLMDKNFIAVICLLKENYPSTLIPQSMGQHQDLICVTAAKRICGLYNKLSIQNPFLKGSFPFKQPMQITILLI